MPKGSKRGVPWTRIVAEFFAIFAGITLSLLADDWRQSRADTAEERALLVSLVDDLHADSAELVSVLDWAHRHSRGAVWSVRPWSEFAGDPDVRRQVVMIGISGGVQARSTQNPLAANADLVTDIESYLSSN